MRILNAPAYGHAVDDENMEVAGDS